MFQHAFLEVVLAAQHVLEDGHLVPEPASFSLDLGLLAQQLPCRRGEATSRQSAAALVGLVRFGAQPLGPGRRGGRLLREPSAAREVAWRRTNISDDFAVTLLALDDPEVATNLGNNDRIPSGVRWRLAQHSDPEVRASATRNTILEEFRPGCESRSLCWWNWPTIRARRSAHGSPSTPGHPRWFVRGWRPIRILASAR